MDDFIKYLLVTDQLDEVFWGKEKDDSDKDLVLKRTLKKNDKEKDITNKNSSSFTK